MEEDTAKRLDSPKRHSDPAPCTSNQPPPNSSSSAQSVPDLICYGRGSPARSPHLQRSTPSTPGPKRPLAPKPSRRMSSGNATNYNSAQRRATHPNTSPKSRFRRGSDDPKWSAYRSRGCSLQTGTYKGDRGAMATCDEGSYVRLRSFSVTAKGLVNLGDLVRARSPSVTSDESSSGVEQDFRDRLSSVESSASVHPCPRYSVLLLGAEEVGKSSLVAQFTTSECLTSVATDLQVSLEGSQERTVSLLVDGEETELTCEDPNDSSYEIDESTYYSNDAFLVVYSLTDKKSLSFAMQLMEKLQGLAKRCQCLYPGIGPKVIILVANKVDLVRSRTITAEEGKSMADKLGIKYIETSVGFDHNVDELLVGIVTQIRLKQALHQRQAEHKGFLLSRSAKFTCKAKGFMDRLLQKCEIKTRSCDNLNVL